jgi:hypothetical protein
MVRHAGVHDTGRRSSTEIDRQHTIAWIGLFHHKAVLAHFTKDIICSDQESSPCHESDQNSTSSLKPHQQQNTIHISSTCKPQISHTKSKGYQYFSSPVFPTIPPSLPLPHQRRRRPHNPQQRRNAMLLTQPDSIRRRRRAFDRRVRDRTDFGKFLVIVGGRILFLFLFRLLSFWRWSGDFGYGGFAWFVVFGGWLCGRLWGELCFFVVVGVFGFVCVLDGSGSFGWSASSLLGRFFGTGWGGFVGLFGLFLLC